MILLKVIGLIVGIILAGRGFVYMYASGFETGIPTKGQYEFTVGAVLILLFVFDLI